jgi:hypothetical protein
VLTYQSQLQGQSSRAMTRSEPAAADGPHLGNRQDHAVAKVFRLPRSEEPLPA